MAISLHFGHNNNNNNINNNNNNNNNGIGKKIGDHITNTIFTKNRIVRNSQNPEKGVGYLKEGERIPLGPLVVGYNPIPWEVKRHKISL